jgi:NAD(P)H-hydrate epimerase
MRVGAGLVTLATPASLQPILASKLTEVTYLPLAEFSPGIISAEAAGLLRQKLKQYDVLLMGCGLGQDLSVARFIKCTLLRQKSVSLPLVLDADALNILAKMRNWWRKLPDNAILTPHPGEIARLIGVSVDEVQSDRVDVVREMAQEWRKTVVLKGAYTIVATPEGRCRISPFANPGLASAGTGDVLSGVIAGLVAQGLSVSEAAACGVYLHGKAGDQVRDKLGDAGMLASDLLSELPLVIKRLKQDPTE